MKTFTVELDQAEVEFIIHALRLDVQQMQERLSTPTRRDSLKRITIFENWRMKSMLLKRFNLLLRFRTNETVQALGVRNGTCV